MKISHVILATLWIVCVIALVSAVITKSKSLALFGDVMLALSYGVSSAMCLLAGRYWIGIAFAFPALRQAYVLLAPVKGGKRV